MEETKKCPYCGEEILAIAKKCKHCGEWLNKEVKKEQIPCPICGELIDKGATKCPHCDESLNVSDKSDDNKQEDTSEKETQEYDDVLLHCKTCGEVIQASESVCVCSCGDNDPLYIKKICNIYNCFRWISLILGFVALLLFAAYTGIDYTERGLLGYVFATVLFLSMAALFNYTLRRYVGSLILSYYNSRMRSKFSKRSQVWLWRQIVLWNIEKIE